MQRFHSIYTQQYNIIKVKYLFNLIKSKEIHSNLIKKFYILINFIKILYDTILY